MKAALGILSVLVPLAAVGPVLLMVGAVVTHARRGEFSAIAVNAVLILLSAVVAGALFQSRSGQVSLVGECR